MTFLSGLAEIEAAIAPQEREERVKLDYLSLKNGESRTVQPLQELDPSSEGYREDKGLAFITWYHQSPYNWQRSGSCTAKESQCLPCELNGSDMDENGEARAWYARKRFYINLVVFPTDAELAKDPEAKPEVKAFHCTTTGQGILPDLVEWYKTNGPISTQVFTLTRKGEKRETNYTLTPQLRTEALDLSPFEPQDTKAGGFPNVAYERQAKFYEYVPPAVRAAVAEQDRTAATIDW